MHQETGLVTWEFAYTSKPKGRKKRTAADLSATARVQIVEANGCGFTGLEKKQKKRGQIYLINLRHFFDPTDQ